MMSRGDTTRTRLAFFFPKVTVRTLEKPLPRIVTTWGANGPCTRLRLVTCGSFCPFGRSGGGVATTGLERTVSTRATIVTTANMSRGMPGRVMIHRFRGRRGCDSAVLR